MSARQAASALEARRSTFAPAGRLHSIPDDVVVTEVNAGGVPAHWLVAPGADARRVLLFLHGGGFELGSLRSDGELAARLGRASGMRVLFPEYRLAPSIRSPRRSTTSSRRGVGCATTNASARDRSRSPATSAGGGLAVALLVAARDAGEALPAAAVVMSPTVDMTGSARR